MFFGNRARSYTANEFHARVQEETLQTYFRNPLTGSSLKQSRAFSFFEYPLKRFVDVWTVILIDAASWQCAARKPAVAPAYACFWS